MKLIEKNKILFFAAAVSLAFSAARPSFAKSDSSAFAKTFIASFSLWASANLYSSYLTISLIDDYLDDQEAYENFEGVIAALEDQTKQIFEDLDGYNGVDWLGKSDFAFLFKVKGLYYLLKEDLNALKNYLRLQSDEAYSQFIEAHRRFFKRYASVFEIPGGDEEENGNGGERGEWR